MIICESRTAWLPVGLQQHGGAEVAVGVPPVSWARGAAARAEDALVEAVQFGAILHALLVRHFPNVLLLHILLLQVGLDGAVLRVEVRHVGHEIFHDVHVR